MEGNRCGSGLAMWPGFRKPGVEILKSRKTGQERARIGLGCPYCSQVGTEGRWKRWLVAWKAGARALLERVRGALTFNIIALSEISTGADTSKEK
jgi:hypothetical protein